MQQNGRGSLRAEQAAQRVRERHVALGDVTAGALWVDGAPESEGVGVLHEILAREPRQLLVVPNPHYVPPYESAYRGRYAPGTA